MPCGCADIPKANVSEQEQVYVVANSDGALFLHAYIPLRAPNRVAKTNHLLRCVKGCFAELV